jgi:hypothetical protein
MAVTKIASGSVPGCEYETYRHGQEFLHRVKITGPVTVTERIPLYRLTLDQTDSTAYFCILDNSGRYDNSLTHADMQLLDRMAINAGISHFYGATVTFDPTYPRIVKLARLNAEIAGLTGELLATGDPTEAEHFILTKIEQYRTQRDHLRTTGRDQNPNR